MSEYVENLRNVLTEAGATFQVIKREPTYTAQETAAAAHLPGHAFVKSVVVNADGRPTLLAVPAPHFVDTEVLRVRLGSKSVRLAEEDEFRDLFPGCELGAIPPFPPADMPLYVDKGLLANKEISFKVGSHTEIATLSTDAYVRAAKPQVLELAEEPEVALPAGQPAEGRPAYAAAAQSGWLFGAVAAGAGIAVPLMAWRLIRPDWLRRSVAVFAGGVAAGGALVALADPRLGRRRRALVRDKGGHYIRLGLRRGSGELRRLRDRSRGLEQRIRHRGHRHAGNAA